LNTATRNSKRTRTATGRLLGVLGVFWLNLVVAPCAMAFSAEHDCPHCPPEMSDEKAAHHGHHQDDAASACDALMSDCDDLGSYANEARFAQLKLKDKTDPVAMAPPALPDTPVAATGSVPATADPPDPVGAFPPLHLLNCVFLD
jgi:hypothetical protein